MDPDPDPRKENEVDPDPDLDSERGLKWIRIRPNAVDPGGSGSGSETLVQREFFMTNINSRAFNMTPNVFIMTNYSLNMVSGLKKS